MLLVKFQQLLEFSLQPVAGHHIADETDSIDVVPEGVKNIQGSHVSMETKVDEVVAKKSGIKLSATQNATKQTEPGKITIVSDK